MNFIIQKTSNILPNIKFKPNKMDKKDIERNMEDMKRNSQSFLFEPVLIQPSICN